MTWVCMPINASAGAPAYSGQNFRDAVAALTTQHSTGSARPLGAWSGRRPGSWLITAATPGGAITIAPGAGVLDTETPVATGAYLVSSDANDTSLTLAARHATLDRIDGVYIQVNDTDVDASGLRNAAPQYVSGTAGSGVPPTSGIPARTQRIGVILVPSAANGGATVVTMDKVFAVAAGGLLPVDAGVRPSAPYAGHLIYNPAGQEDSPASIGVWVTLGNITVPAWATKARISLVYHGVWMTSTGAVTEVRVTVGGVNGTLVRYQPHDPGAATPVQQPLSIQDVLTGLTPGVRAVTLDARQISGAGILRSGTSRCVAFFDWYA